MQQKFIPEQPQKLFQTLPFHQRHRLQRPYQSLDHSLQYQKKVYNHLKWIYLHNQLGVSGGGGVQERAGRKEGVEPQSTCDHKTSIMSFRRRSWKTYADWQKTHADSPKRTTIPKKARRLAKKWEAFPSLQKMTKWHKSATIVCRPEWCFCMMRILYEMALACVQMTGLQNKYT